MKNPMVLSGDANVPAMPITDSEVNHLRRVLAWLRCEYGLEEFGQLGYMKALVDMKSHGLIDAETASNRLAAHNQKANHVPACVRQGVKMLSRAITKHDHGSGVVDSIDALYAKERGELVKKIEAGA